ncbi:MAG: ATP-binding protein [Nitrospiraceae bacterium]|nr:ATP-binding protein [Nitrospirota bacterium]MDA8214281.1 ATP-binding protein [Nitrospiraceae bacterium]MDA8339061.1 ATP-binding protein [Nitrospiraceae bacterium]
MTMSYNTGEKSKIGKTLLQQDITFDEKLQKVVNILTELLKVKRCSIMIVNPEDLTLEVKASTNPEIIGLKRKLCDVTIATRALIDDEPFHSDGKRRSFFKPLEFSQYSSEDSLSVPIKYFDKKLGVINLTDSEGGRPFTIEQEVIATDIAQHLAPYIYAEQTKELLERKVKQLESANKQLVELDELKTSLTSFIVHDLKGPITTIMANLDMLNYEPLTPQQFEYVNLAAEDVYKMQNMVMNILDVLKLEEGKIRIYREETDIYTLSKREITSLKNVLSRRNIELAVEGNSHICYIDENLIGRVITNLLRNAIEHSPDRGRISLTIQYHENKKETVISIADRGKGVPDEMKDRIFDKFFQMEGETKQRKTSTGLGLTFCKLVVNAHGGNIWVEDSGDGGAKFIFTLPETLKEGII